MGSREIEEALGATLDAVESGETTLEEALNRYPALRADLEPLVTLAMELRAIPSVVAPDSLRAYKRPVFSARVTQERSASWWRKLPLPVSPFHGWTPALVRAAAAIAVVVTLGSGTLAASAGSLPEEALHPLKLAIENARLAITPDSSARAELEMHFATRRLEEVETAVERGRPLVVEQSLVLYEERLESALAGSPEEQEDGEEQQLQEALKHNHEALQRILSEPDKIQNPQARAAIDAAAQRTLERAEKLRQSRSSEQQPGAAGEKAPEKPGNASDKSEKANPSSDAPGQQRSVAPPSGSAIDVAGHQPTGEVRGVREKPAGAGEYEPAGAGKEKRIN